MPATKVKEPQKPTEAPANAEKRYRLVVKSAEEGLNIIRDKFGNNAEVVSVRQVDGQGLAKFLTSPKLEITFKVSQEAGKETADVEAEGLEKVHPAEEAKGAGQSPKLDVQLAPAEPSPKENTADPARRDVPSQEDPSVPAGSPSSADLSVYGLLRRSGFDEGLLAALLDSPELKGLEALPLSHALAEISHWLKSRYNSIRIKPMTSRVAYFGTPGSGKTTALCKVLAHSAFFENRIVHVFKLDQDIPNPDDALRIFCESLGIGLYRDKAAVKLIDDEDILYVDTSGVPLKDRQGWKSLSKGLDQLEISTRVLVLNASYDTQILKATLEAATVCRPTHLVFTHFDELHNSTKLWPFVFSQEVSTLMLTHGQNITSDYTRDNLCQFLLASSFPSQVLQPI